jgi:serine/threonine-protein kinase
MSADTDRLNTALSGRYRIERELGAGGMATVYLAEDLKHDRKVAIKVLKPELAAVLGAERFVVEIKTTAAMSHPHILPLFDSGTADGFLFYVMPYIQGETIREKLNRETQFGVDEAVRIAREVADALDYAHRHGVIHRDIKPENLLLHDGRAMVMDFGIALAVSAAAGGRMTETGLSLGTPHYMSPEQATAEKEITARSDVYSLASVLYEMLAGQPPHIGGAAQQVIMKIITEAAQPVTALRKSVPPNVAAAVATALEKLPADRFATAKEFGDALANPGFTGAVTTIAQAAGARSDTTRLTRFRIAVAAGVTLVFAAAFTGYRFAGTPAGAGVTRYALTLRGDERITDDGGSQPLAISPDGQVVAYLARRGNVAQVFVRPTGELLGRPVAGTEGALQVAFSPDGQSIAFVTATQLNRVSVDGSGLLTVASVSGPLVRGLTWSRSGSMIAGMNGDGLRSFPAGGGEPRLLTSRPGVGRDHRWPLALRDGKTVLFTYGPAGSLAEVWAVRMPDTVGRRLVQGMAPLGVLDGRLVYVDYSGAIRSIAYDEAKATVSGGATAVGDGVSVEANTGMARAALSATGDLVFQQGRAQTQLVVADLLGRTRPLGPDDRSYDTPRFSPDGNRVAVSVATDVGSNIWLYDRKAGTLSPLTSGRVSDVRPEWTPDGKRVLFNSVGRAASPQTIWWQAADGSDAPALVAVYSAGAVVEAQISPDGGTLLARVNGGGAVNDIWYRRLTGPDTSFRKLVEGPGFESGPRFSPDGHWVAYSSDEARGRREVYVTPFPGPGARIQISTDGGEIPVWAHDGHRLYYVRDGELWVAELTVSVTVTVSARKRALEGRYIFRYSHASYDVSPDGTEILLLRAIGDAPVVVVHGWGAELRARARDRVSR